MKKIFSLIAQLLGLVPTEHQDQARRLYDTITGELEEHETNSNEKKTEREKQLEAELATTKATLSELTEKEKKTRELIEAQQQKEAAAAVEGKIDEAIRAGKITKEDAPTWKARLEKDFDGYAQVLDAFPTQRQPGASPTNPPTEKKEVVVPKTFAELKTAAIGEITEIAGE